MIPIQFTIRKPDFKKMVGGIGDFCLFIVIKKKDLSTYNN